MKIFLGCTIPSSWREILIPVLDEKGIDYFNPIVDDWTEDEELEKQSSTIRLYVITPKMQGVYSIAEVVNDSNKCPNKTVLVILSTDELEEFDTGQLKSLIKVKKIVDDNGAKSFLSLDSFINSL